MHDGIEGLWSHGEHLACGSQSPRPGCQAFPRGTAGRGDESLDGDVGEHDRAAGLACQIEARPALPGTHVQQPPTRAELEDPNELVDLGQRRISVRTEVTPERAQFDLTSDGVLADGVRPPSTLDAVVTCGPRRGRPTSWAHRHGVGHRCSASDRRLHQ